MSSDDKIDEQICDFEPVLTEGRNSDEAQNLIDTTSL
jgi:hypothetical protein